MGVCTSTSRPNAHTYQYRGLRHIRRRLLTTHRCGRLALHDLGVVEGQHAMADERQPADLGPHRFQGFAFEYSDDAVFLGKPEGLSDGCPPHVAAARFDLPRPATQLSRTDRESSRSRRSASVVPSDYSATAKPAVRRCSASGQAHRGHSRRSDAVRPRSRPGSGPHRCVDQHRR
jgi:hypothetical protein